MSRVFQGFMYKRSKICTSGHLFSRRELRAEDSGLRQEDPATEILDFCKISRSGVEVAIEIIQLRPYFDF